MVLSGESLSAASRKETRIPAVVPVRIYGMDADGKPFGVNVATLNISRNGVLLSKVDVNLNVGDVIGLQKGVGKAKYRVKWLGQKGTPTQGQAGLECMEPARNIFGIEEPGAVSAVQESAGVQRRRGGNAVGPETGERRAAPRFKCDLGIQVRMEGSEMNLWSRCTDISEGGCYVESRSPIKVGTTLSITFFLQPDNLTVSAIARTSFPGMGVGVQFQFPSSVEADRMRNFVGERFSHQAKPAPTPAKIVPVVAPGPTRISAAVAAPTVAPSGFPEFARLEEYVSSTLSWAESAGLKDSDRTDLEDLALSLRRELRGLRSEIEERYAQGRDRESSPKVAG